MGKGINKNKKRSSNDDSIYNEQRSNEMRLTLADISKHSDTKSIKSLKSNRSNRSRNSNRSRMSSARSNHKKELNKPPSAILTTEDIYGCTSSCKTGQLIGTKFPKFTWEELKDIKVIRRINKDQYKELGHMLDDGKGNIPIFGYPLICYSPNSNP